MNLLLSLAATVDGGYATADRRFAWWYHAADKRTNVTAALELLEANPRAATSFLAYCNDTVAPSGRFAFGTTPACEPDGQLTAGLKKLGVGMERCLGHVDDAATLRALLANADEALADLVALVQANPYVSGYSFDIEAQGTNASDITAYTAFLARVRAALESCCGARLTAYGYSAHHSATSSDFRDLSQAIDRLLVGDTYNDDGGRGFPGWLAEYAHVVGSSSNVPLDKAAPGMMGSSERGDWNCEEEAIAQRMARVEADGVREVVVFDFDPRYYPTAAACPFSPRYNRTICPCTRAWITAAQQFLAVRPDRATS
jgi:hypothetical protein